MFKGDSSQSDGHTSDLASTPRTNNLSDEIDTDRSSVTEDICSLVINTTFIFYYAQLVPFLHANAFCALITAFLNKKTQFVATI